MSVDFYVAVPAANWPSAASVQRCMTERGYPIQVKRFPSFNPKQVVTDGTLVSLDEGTDAYLEGELFSVASSSGDVDKINKRLAATADRFRFSSDDAVMSIRVRSSVEMQAASYMIAGLIVCFHGYGFEPQGNEHGREDFAKALIDGARVLKDF